MGMVCTTRIVSGLCLGNSRDVHRVQTGTACIDQIRTVNYQYSGIAVAFLRLTNIIFADVLSSFNIFHDFDRDHL